MFPLTTNHQAQVSVIIPCYRCGETIGRAVASVFGQTLRPAEVILIDDCSGDGTLHELNRLRDLYPARWLRVLSLKHNAGPGAARNAGWNEATQAYIAFLDSDDTWHTQKIEIQYGWMCVHPNAALTGHAWNQRDGLNRSSDELISQQETARFTPVSKGKLLLSNCFSTPSVMLRRTVPVRFDEGKRHSEDYLLWLEIVCGGFAAYRCDLALAYLYKAPYGQGGLSAQLWKMECGQLDTYRTIFKKGHINVLSYVILYCWSWIRFIRRLVKVMVRSRASR